MALPYISSKQPADLSCRGSRPTGVVHRWRGARLRASRHLEPVAFSLLAVLVCACGGNSGTTRPTPTLTNLVIAGNASFTALGQTSQLSAIVSFSDGTSQNVTTSASWISSNSSVVSVSSSGLATARGAGTALITAAYQQRTASIGTAVTVSTPCGYSLSNNSKGYPASGGVDSVNVTTSRADCAWTARVDQAWVTITSGQSGQGNGAVSYSVAANDNASSRAATLTVAGLSGVNPPAVETISQAGQTATDCEYQLTSAKQVSFGIGGGSGTSTFTLSSGTNCTWTAVVPADFPWIAVLDSSGSDDIVVRFTVATNPTSSPRQGHIEIRWPGPQVGENIIITQAGASASRRRSLTAPGTAPNSLRWADSVHIRTLWAGRGETPTLHLPQAKEAMGP